MKKFIALLLLAALALSAAACTNTSDTNDTTASADTTAAPDETTAAPLPTDTISGDLVEILIGLNSGVLPEEVMLENAILEDAEMGGYQAGISADDFTKYIETFAVSIPMMNAQAHHTFIAKCKDAESALALKDAVEEGFDPGRWVCVTPEKMYLGISGTYVYFVASNAETADGLFANFESLSGELPVQKFEFDTTPFMARG